MTRKDYKMTTIDLFPAQYKGLKVMAALKNCPFTEIVRYAVDAYLNNNLPEYIKTQHTIRKYKEISNS